MKYFFLHVMDSSAADKHRAQADGRLGDWIAEMTARGVLLHGSRLRPVTDATTVRGGGNDLLVLDGPFAETKEQIAGYDVVECADLDEAIDIASSHPTTTIGSIEIRPVWG